MYSTVFSQFWCIHHFGLCILPDVLQLSWEPRSNNSFSSSQPWMLHLLAYLLLFEFIQRQKCLESTSFINPKSSSWSPDSKAGDDPGIIPIYVAVL